MKRKIYFREFFNYTKTEREGITVLLIVICIVCFSPSIYSKIESRRVVELCSVNSNFIILPVVDTVPSLIRKKKIFHYKDYDKKIMVEINSADTAELKKVRGIGHWYSYKITRYRNRLGGYWSLNQLKELNLREGVFEKISSQLKVDKTKIKKIDFDTISFKNLLRHPYFDYKTVKAIFKVRNEYRGITGAYLLKARIIDSVEYEKIKPYLAN